MGTASKAHPNKHVLGLAIALVLATLLAACTPEETDMMQVINNGDRAPAGLPALAPNAALYFKAAGWAQHMANTQQLSHSTLSDGNPYRWRSLGENVGVAGSVGQLNSLFMGSAGHRTNIMSTSYQYFAVGIAFDGAGRMWAAEEFMQL